LTGTVQNKSYSGIFWCYVTSHSSLPLLFSPSYDLLVMPGLFLLACPSLFFMQPCPLSFPTLAIALASSPVRCYYLVSFLCCVDFFLASFFRLLSPLLVTFDFPVWTVTRTPSRLLRVLSLPSFYHISDPGPFFPSCFFIRPNCAFAQ